MAHLVREFTWSEEYNGGWLPIVDGDDSLMRPGSGMTTAHDVLEHFAMDGTQHDELMAFGAYWFGRVENGYNIGNNPEWVLADDLVEVMYDQFAALSPLRKCGRTDNAEFLDEARAPVREHFLQIAAQRSIEPERFFCENEEERDAVIADWFDNAWPWLRHGYLRARRRWVNARNAVRGVNQYTARDVFEQLSTQVDKDIKYYSEFFVDGVTRMKVIVGIASASIRLRYFVEGREYEWSM